MAQEIRDSEFTELVKNATTPVLVDFWAPWCGPCRMLGPILEEIAEEVGEEAAVYKMNVDENQETAGTFGITSIPTVIIFDKGEVKEKLIGVQPKKQYLHALGLSS
ncbi:thioredoxin [Chitinivibrio alkaliphilus]|uniref:Thioredoxin n=1 Tax=Chitinivibrio alkaliphilus ACht1 TaxID=1313304 RepID=U7D5E5_9BACT|nr:thioredoxin [Chitinivibrio alkaliphilus]ERP31173.1 thioredoxin [Chitinivibrio alkaliphilus ACht1]